jgi:low affinity Fe/Cu permease
MNRQLSERFASMASFLSKWMGTPWALFIAALLVVIGLMAFGVDRTNIAISIATLLMVFILQNSQNRDAAALHVKLDEVITHLEGPRDDVAGIETKSHEEIEELHETPRGGRSGGGSPETGCMTTGFGRCSRPSTRRPATTSETP